MFKRTRTFFGNRVQGVKRRTKQVFNWDEARNNASEVRDAVKQVTRIPQGREETFANAYRRLKLDEAQLAQSHRYHSMRFYIFSVFFTVALGVFLFSLLRAEWFSVLPSLGAMLMLGALAFQASFQLFKIERRAFMPVREWVHTPSSWIPAPFQPQAQPTASSSTSLRQR